MLNRLRVYLAADIDFKPLFDRIYPFSYGRSEVRTWLNLTSLSGPYRGSDEGGGRLEPILEK